MPLIVPRTGSFAARSSAPFPRRISSRAAAAAASKSSSSRSTPSAANSIGCCCLSSLASAAERRSLRVYSNSRLSVARAASARTSALEPFLRAPVEQPAVRPPSELLEAEPLGLPHRRRSAGTAAGTASGSSGAPPLDGAIRGGPPSPFPFPALAAAVYK
eukprot:scaffold130974_cov21-Tisochrysis_lutea.AAC.1